MEDIEIKENAVKNLKKQAKALEKVLNSASYTNYAWDAIVNAVSEVKRQISATQKDIDEIKTNEAVNTLKGILNEAIKGRDDMYVEGERNYVCVYADTDVCAHNILTIFFNVNEPKKFNVDGVRKDGYFSWDSAFKTDSYDEIKKAVEGIKSAFLVGGYHGKVWEG